MSTNITWQEIAIRLACTLLAGAIIGANRGEHGRPAGMRTTVLVALAAALSMIEVNLLLGVAGKAPNSFVVLDLMRLPLGILSGMGFIGGGAILRRDNMVIGVTTAATLWFVTMLGLCFGGGQIGLGFVALVIALVVLTGFKWVEMHWIEDRKATLTVAFSEGGMDEAALRRSIERDGHRIEAWKNVVFTDRGAIREIQCQIKWRGRPVDTEPPAFLNELARHAMRVEWKA
jgi:putative Mg2+ transporter-C (MgtC) family protein